MFSRCFADVVTTAIDEPSRSRSRAEEPECRSTYPGDRVSPCLGRLFLPVVLSLLPGTGNVIGKAIGTPCRRTPWPPRSCEDTAVQPPGGVLSLNAESNGTGLDPADRRFSRSTSRQQKTSPAAQLRGSSSQEGNVAHAEAVVLPFLVHHHMHALEHGLASGVGRPPRALRHWRRLRKLVSTDGR